MRAEDWEPWAIKTYGSLEAARAIRRRAGNKSSRNKGKDSGFAKMKREDPERHKEITRRGGKNRAQKLKATQDQDTTEAE